MPNPFYKPTTPKNSLQLLQWLIFEPVLLERYEKTLTKTQTAIIVLKAFIVNFFVVIIPLTLMLYAISVFIIASFDLPLFFPPDLPKNMATNEAFVQQWQTYSTVWEKAYFFISFNSYKNLIILAVGLTFSLPFGLVFALAIGLTRDLVGGLAFSLGGSLAVSSAVGLLGGLAAGLAFGLAVGLTSSAGGLAVGLAKFRLGIFLAFTLVVSLIFILSGGLAGGLTFPIFFYLSYFRLGFYPWHFLKSQVHVSLTSNPYMSDGAIWLPIWGMTRKLTVQAQQDPKTGLAFVNFLQEYRPLQTQLAMHITHAATAGYWQHHPLQKDYLLSPPLIQETPQLTPSEKWLAQIDKLKNQLIAYENEHQISLKKDQFAICSEQLQMLRELTLFEPYRWHHYYLPALDQWLTEAQQRLSQLAEDAQQQEPITRNIYRYGEILDPDTDNTIFLGREDLKVELKQQILTARTMPMFLCYGQRRVGKSSLLKFLPRLLGSRFQVIYQDCQSSNVDSLHHWLQDLQRLLDKTWQPTKPIDWQATDNWLATWGKMQHYLKTRSYQQPEKIILAFDEYEALHERILSTDPKQGKMLLEAMRSFSQQQNQIVFLFTGAAQFADLKNPNWDRCFIHAMPLPVDYLKPEDATRLITEPVDLNYPTAVIERMWAITQGHPALLQMLCRYLVNIANTEARKNMTLTDLEQVISQKIVQRNTYALNTFWTEFCPQHQCRPAVEQILANQPITDQASLLKLEDYGYIIPDGTRWKLRVPLLEMWLQRYRAGFQ